MDTDTEDIAQEIKEILEGECPKTQVVVELYKPIFGLGEHPRGYIIKSVEAYVIFQPKDSKECLVIFHNNLAGMKPIENKDIQTVVPVE